MAWTSGRCSRPSSISSGTAGPRASRRRTSLPMAVSGRPIVSAIEVSRWRVRPLVNPELVHPEERIGVFLLERIPVLDAGPGRVVWKPLPVAGRHVGIGIEADELQAVLRQERRDRRKVERVFLHVE